MDGWIDSDRGVLLLPDAPDRGRFCRQNHGSGRHRRTASSLDSGNDELESDEEAVEVGFAFVCEEVWSIAKVIPPGEHKSRRSVGNSLFPQTGWLELQTLQSKMKKTYEAEYYLQ